MPGRSGVPVMRAWPVTGFLSRHIVVVKVQPIRRTSEPSSDSSIFWPTPVVRAWVSAASAPPKASMAVRSRRPPRRCRCASSGPAWNRPRRCRPAPAPSNRCRADGRSGRACRSPRSRHRPASGLILRSSSQPKPFLSAALGPEVLAEDVGLGDELVQDGAALGRLQVQRHALHAAIVGLEEGAGHAGQHGHAARAVAAVGRLDLDHVGAEIGHQHVGHGARLRRRAGNDLDALQRTPATKLRHLTRLPTRRCRTNDRPRSGRARPRAGPAPAASSAA